MEESRQKSLMREYIEAIITSIVIAALIITFVGQSTIVDGESMYPTLKDGDRLWLDKLSYRFGDPRRGDIVVVKVPSGERYIKRIIGLPGEKVAITRGKLYINGKFLFEPYIKQPMQGDWGPVEVPPNDYVVLGDNRNNSEDSRELAIGFLPRKRILGKTVLRYFPFSSACLMRNPLTISR